ncbi:cholesterol transport system auxiliary component [Luteimonas cucumeris]|uniref:Cholesterol transport system auxiliary component n=1 Tax=Luteimonas cucumeris TaxID=985012 RepID=A0A562L683_9GAMM|nr:ABC-type transport auxiliary lipoprotein family protein [Luteimonas cucumeris]TWI02954.1 cholesterol transport system auxiliary component [Luteimonas cucumeris]
MDRPQAPRNGAQPASRRPAAIVVAIALACALLLGGCSSILGGSPRDRVTTYAPDPRISADPAWPAVTWQLAIVPPTSARWTDSLRIAVRPTPGELQVYKGANWAKPPTVMIEDAILRGLEDSGRIPAVARQASGISADYRLIMDLRRFEADYAGAAVPSAVIELNAMLLHRVDQQVVSSRTFLSKQVAASTAIPDVAAAFDPALGDIAKQVAGWTLTEGAVHDHSHRQP